MRRIYLSAPAPVDDISIHAPMKDATFRNRLSVKKQADFNPRTHEGCDLLRGDINALIIISIHAPMKDATTSTKVARTYTNNFNPRTHEGCDLTLLSWMVDEERISIHAPMKDATAIFDEKNL